ncbi:Translation elongation factor P (EF-P)/translation initiation factor 5A (eIF-5A) [Halanaeroarchaeum sp. HSR-CO]|uniref:agmatinase n=1 Tax=Halanaeroarchaeum sp. HSR-CO TaxID=2866382 RepID=UPI00217D0385|nr:agmatinase [Halanaeroarchaeum sp. HSR-CO]UWG48711.1 Translation elongation factor P (EF-P)/translation initiation factor 5A (eIF-5A) [Halanaeroarchaeum sp. HSR-CO]
MFPGATTERDAADYVVVGAPLDVSTTFQPGTRFGPDRIRRFAETFDDYDRRTDQFFTDLAVHDHGDVHAWDDAAEYLEYVNGVLTDVVRDDAVPLLLGGEHTVSKAGVEAVSPDIFVTLDAHLDLRSDYAGNELSHATVTRHALETADRAVILGARTGSEAEWNRAAESDVTVVAPADVADWQPEFDATADVYLSVDIDGADPGFAPGTGTMEPFGLTPREMRDVVRAVAPQVAGIDVVEVNDRDDGQAPSLGAKLLRTAVYEHAASQ